MIYLAQSAPWRGVWRCCRYCLAFVVLLMCGLAIARAVIFESFDIPTGSMAPSLRGRHRVCVCPSCGHEVVVGRHRTDQDGTGHARFYRKAFCQNCGLFPLPVTDSPEIEGDQVVVNRAAFLVRSPSRWEIVVFRLLETFYIKRLLGLPGEEIRIKDGDLYVNGRLCRKSLEEARKLRVLLQTGLGGRVSGRAEAPGSAGASPSRMQPECGSDKCEPIRDEYAYNAGVHADSECVHDFSIETEITAAPGLGTLSLRLCDGHEWVEVLLPIGQTATLEAFAWPTSQPEATRKLAEAKQRLGLVPGRRYRVEMAFVDRRLSLALDGRLLLQTDLPEVENRAGVVRPFQVKTEGVDVRFHDFRLYRDVHYGQQGKNAVRGKSVRLGVDQYFLLGDNSPCSQDSRSWPGDGAVDGSSLIGPVSLVRPRKSMGTRE